jgi:sugar phosphate isomerase/epimerase
VTSRRKWNISFIPYYMVAPAVWRAPGTAEAMEVLKEAGYDGVEWMLGQHFQDAEGLRKLVAETRRKGLVVSDAMCWQDFVTLDKDVRRNRVATQKEMIAATAASRVPIVNMFTGPMTWDPKALKLGKDISEGAAWSSVVDALSDLVEFAEKEGVTLTIEPVFGMVVHDYYTVRELLSYFKSDRIAVNLDPSHFVLYGNDPVWAVSRLGRRIRHVHVKDAFGKPGGFGETFSFPFLGEGLIDWKGFFGELMKTGYEGFLSLEFENDAYLRNVCDGDWRKAAVQLIDRVGKFLP